MRSLLKTTFILLTMAVATAGAQWTRTSGPEGGSVRGIAIHPRGLLALLQSEELYRYSKSEAKWTLTRRLPAYSLYSVGDTLIADGVSGMIRSLDGGDTWESIGSSGAIWTLDVIGSTIYAMDVGANVLRSTNGGTTWRKFANLAANVQTIAADDSIALLSIHGLPGIYRTTDDGATWHDVDGFPKNSSPWRLIYHDGAFYAALNSIEGYRSLGVYRSDDSGTTWYPVNHGLPQWNGRYPLIYDFYSHNGDLSMATTDGVYRSGAGGWRRTLADFAIGVAIDPSGEVYLGTGGGVLRSDGDGWSGIRTNMIAGDVNDLLVDGGTILAAANDGVHRTTDAGTTWERTLEGSTLLLARDGRTTYAIQARAINGSIHASTDDGATWNDARGNLLYPGSATSVAVGSAGVYVGFHNVRQSDDGSGLVWRAGGVHGTTDGGASWRSVSNGLPHHDTVPTPVLHLAAIDHALLAVTADGLYRSINDGEEWTSAPLNLDGAPVTAVGAHNGDFLVALNGYVLRSSDMGETWTRIDPADTLRAPIEQFYSLGDRLIAREINPSPTMKIYMLDGDDWRAINQLLPEGVTPYSFALAGNRVVLGTFGAAVWTGSIDGVSGVDDPRPSAGGETTIIPNPVTGRGTLIYRLRQAGDVRLTIMNVVGVPVLSRDLGSGVEGENSLEVDMKGVAPGIYFYRIESNNSVRIGRLVKK